MNLITQKTSAQCCSFSQAARQPLSDGEAAEAAAVLDMLLATSVAAADAEALRYVQSTATLLGVRRL